MQSLEAIAVAAHQEYVDESLRHWVPSTMTEAGNLLNALHLLTSYDFIASFCILYSLMSPLTGITQKLQGRGLDIYEAHQHVSLSTERCRTRINCMTG